MSVDLLKVSLVFVAFLEVISHTLTAVMLVIKRSDVSETNHVDILQVMLTLWLLADFSLAHMPFLKSGEALAFKTNLRLSILIFIPNVILPCLCQTMLVLWCG